MDVRAWLQGLELESYAEAFADNDIDGAMLPALTAEDLKDVGVASVGHRRKLLEAISALADGQTETAPALDGQTAPVGERRQVTVLFADLASRHQPANGRLSPHRTGLVPVRGRTFLHVHPQLFGQGAQPEA